MGKSIVKATGAVLIINLFGKVLGFLRTTFIANAYGANTQTDAYLVAYTVPYFLQWVLGAALVAAVVPVLTKYFVEGRDDEGWYVGSAVFNLTALSMCALTVVGFIFSTLLIKVLSPGFEPAETQLAVELTRIMLPSSILMASAMVFTGVVNAKHNFALAAMAPAFSSLIIIGGIVLFADKLGIQGLAWATLLSYLGFLLIHLPALHRVGFRYRPVLGLSHEGVKRILADIIPIALGVAVNQIYFALNRIFASGLAEGTITALDYSNKVMMLPLGIFVAAVTATIYPTLSELAIKNKKNDMAKALKTGISAVCLISIPAVVGLIVLRVPIIELLFERGAFDHASTLATANALMYFSIGMVPMAVNMVITRAFYSLNDMKTPVRLGLYSIIINLGLSVVLFRMIAHGGGGLALANALAAIINMLMLYRVLGKKLLPELKENGMGSSIGKMSLAALAMGIVVYLINHFLYGSTSVVIVVGLGVIAGCLVYALAVILLKVNEVEYYKAKIRAKIHKK